LKDKLSSDLAATEAEEGERGIYMTTSGFGTFATCRAGLTMSVGRARPEVAGPRSERRV
jgi:hypothetical protein